MNFKTTDIQEIYVFCLSKDCTQKDCVLEFAVKYKDGTTAKINVNKSFINPRYDSMDEITLTKRIVVTDLFQKCFKDSKLTKDCIHQFTDKYEDSKQEYENKTNEYTFSKNAINLFAKKEYLRPVVLRSLRATRADIIIDAFNPKDPKIINVKDILTENKIIEIDENGLLIVTDRSDIPSSIIYYGEEAEKRIEKQKQQQAEWEKQEKERIMNMTPEERKIYEEKKAQESEERRIRDNIWKKKELIENNYERQKKELNKLADIDLNSFILLFRDTRINYLEFLNDFNLINDYIDNKFKSIYSSEDIMTYDDFQLDLEKLTNKSVKEQAIILADFIINYEGDNLSNILSSIDSELLNQKLCGIPLASFAKYGSKEMFSAINQLNIDKSETDTPAVIRALSNIIANSLSNCEVYVKDVFDSSVIQFTDDVILENMLGEMNEPHVSEEESSKTR